MVGTAVLGRQGPVTDLDWQTVRLSENERQVVVEVRKSLALLKLVEYLHSPDAAALTARKPYGRGSLHSLSYAKVKAARWCLSPRKIA